MSNPSNSIIELGGTSVRGDARELGDSQKLPAFDRFARTVQWAKLHHKEETEA
jgi:hypothetical protein